MFTFLFPKKQKKEPKKTSELSRFFLEASPEERRKVFLEVAKQASKDQRDFMESVK